MVSYRKWKSLNLQHFQDRVKEHLIIEDDSSLSVCVNTYNSVLSQVVDELVPAKTCTITQRPYAPWYTTQVREAKLVRRKLERQWLQSRLQIHYDMLKEQRNKVNILIKELKSKHFTKLVDESKDQKEFFSVTKKLLHKCRVKMLPTAKSDIELAEKFADFFQKKIQMVRHDIKVQQKLQQQSQDYLPICQSELLNFPQASEEEVAKLIMSSASKSCSLDPIPTWLVKECTDILTPIITQIINKSVSTGMFPDELKQALVSPLIKKPSMDPEVLKSYRPVSNLSFISKLIEKHVLSHLQDYSITHNLSDPYQSAYTKFHSTETALLKIQSDLLMAVDKKGAAVLVLLDLSAAFDTIDHGILLKRLEVNFGIKDLALSWVKSYLTNRSQTVIINGVMSGAKPLQYGVPQGSNVGPNAFVKYTPAVGQIAQLHGLAFHCYADDTQLYVAFSPKCSSDIENAIRRIQNCVADIHLWMTCNFLKLNEEKTEVLIVHKEEVSPISTVTFGDNVITTCVSAKNLGVTLDAALNLKCHINQTCRRAYAELHKIGRIRRYLSDKTCASLVHAFVSSRVDYCNSLLFGLPKKYLQKLQRVLNMAARIVSLTRKHEHITPVLISLHWLPIDERIEFKIILLTFKALNGLAPVYLQDILQEYHPSRQLRSASENLLVVPKTKYKYYGDRAFVKCAPVLWNRLPQSLRAIKTVPAFKTALKTHLFKQAYVV